MNRLRIFAVRLLNLFRRGPFERALDAELQAYLELDVNENIRRGMAPKEARRTALARLGGLEMTTIKEQCGDVHRFRALDDLWRDLQFGFRRLRARPILAGVAIAVARISDACWSKCRWPKHQERRSCLSRRCGFSTWMSTGTDTGPERTR